MLFCVLAILPGSSCTVAQRTETKGQSNDEKIFNIARIDKIFINLSLTIKK